QGRPSQGPPGRPLRALQLAAPDRQRRGPHVDLPEARGAPEGRPAARYQRLAAAAARVLAGARVLRLEARLGLRALGFRGFAGAGALFTADSFGVDRAADEGDVGDFDEHRAAELHGVAGARADGSQAGVVELVAVATEVFVA